MHTIRFISIFFTILLMNSLSFCEEFNILYDMGIKDSPLAEDAIPVYQDTNYSTDRGYGWLSPPQNGFNDESGLPEKGDRHHPLHVVPPGKDLYRDGFESEKPIVFRADVANGEYLVTVFLGRYKQRRHDLKVTINDVLLAENIDAWGNVWGSQGGTFIKSVKVPVRVSEKMIQIEVGYEPSRPDSWKEYTGSEPEGGRLWYLGENKSSIVGLRIRSKPAWPIAWDGARLISSKLDANYQPILDVLNEMNSEKALSLFKEAEIDSSFLNTIAIRDTIAAHIDTPDETRLDLLHKSIKELRAFDKQTNAIRERLEVDERVLTALEYIRMWGFSQANEKTGLKIYHRYWGAYELCNAVAPNDPLYPLALLLKTRVAYWNGREGGWKHCYALARQHATELKQFYPDHPLVRMYLGESIRQVYDSKPVPDNTPKWAALQREALGRMREVIHYWVNHRQRENGELGGGWGDDVEILRSWIPLVLATHDKTARLGAKRIADGVYATGVIENGYAKEIGDVEHAAEPVSDTQPLMMAVEHGNPLYFERCMAVMKCMKEVWTANNNNGDLHFKSHYYSATETVDTPPRSADVPLNGRAVKPGIWVMGYSKHPIVAQLLADWTAAWVKAARQGENGKPAGIIPGSISFPEGRIGGYAENWWETKGYDDLTAMGYTAKLYHIMLAVWAETGDESALEPIFAALDAVRTYREYDIKKPTPGSLEWVGMIHDNPAFFDVVEKWRALSGDDRYDDLILKWATGTMRMKLTGDRSRLENELEGIINGLSSNLPMITTEVLFTDRVSIPGSTVLASMITGSFGNPTYYPLHAVTWEGIGDNAAVLVQKSDISQLQAQLYNFNSESCEILMQLWRLSPGAYEITIADMQDSKKILVSQDVVIEEKGQKFDLTLPPQRLISLNIQQKNRIIHAKLLPDLAIGNGDLKVVKPGILSVTLHNLGSAPVYPFTMTITPPIGPTIRKRCRGIEALTDLEPKTVHYEIPYTPPTAKGTFIIQLDAENEIEEICELNNELKKISHLPLPE